MARVLSLGPIALPTLRGDLTETLGDQLEAVGGGVVAGERRPRPLQLRIPVHGDFSDANRFDMGLRLRRQVRALMENPRARLQGLYLAWSPDSEQNCWLLIGGGDLKYAEGGISLADFELELSDCYRVANSRTHRSARRVVRYDRRAATVPRDILETVFSTDFAANAVIARHFLGVGVTDPVIGSTRSPATTATRSTRDGNILYVDGATDGEVIHFEQGESDMSKAIVRVHDSHGSAVEADWEPVYGADQPLAGTPILDNAVCRVVPTVATGILDIQSWTGTTWQTDATVTHQGGVGALRARVVEWTTERAVLCIWSILTATVRGEMYVTLQRGWTGPRIEMYARNAAGSATALVNVVARTAGDATYQRSTGSATAIVANTSIGTFTGLEPWVALLGPGTDRGVQLAVVQDEVNLRGAIYASREGLSLESPTSYVSVTIGLGARASVVADSDELGALNLTDATAVPELVARS